MQLSSCLHGTAIVQDRVGLQQRKGYSQKGRNLGLCHSPACAPSIMWSSWTLARSSIIFKDIRSGCVTPTHKFSWDKTADTGPLWHLEQWCLPVCTPAFNEKLLDFCACPEKIWGQIWDGHTVEQQRLPQAEACRSMWCVRCQFYLYALSTLLAIPLWALCRKEFLLQFHLFARKSVGMDN